MKKLFLLPLLIVGFHSHAKTRFDTGNNDLLEVHNPEKNANTWNSLFAITAGNNPGEKFTTPIINDGANNGSGATASDLAKNSLSFVSNGSVVIVTQNNAARNLSSGEDSIGNNGTTRGPASEAVLAGNSPNFDAYAPKAPVGDVLKDLEIVAGENSTVSATISEPYGSTSTSYLPIDTRGNTNSSPDGNFLALDLNFNAPTFFQNPDGSSIFEPFNYGWANDVNPSDAFLDAYNRATKSSNGAGRPCADGTPLCDGDIAANYNGIGGDIVDPFFTQGSFGTGDGSLTVASNNQPPVINDALTSGAKEAKFVEETSAGETGTDGIGSTKDDHPEEVAKTEDTAPSTENERLAENLGLESNNDNNVWTTAEDICLRSAWANQVKNDRETYLNDFNLFVSTKDKESFDKFNGLNNDTINCSTDLKFDQLEDAYEKQKEKISKNEKGTVVNNLEYLEYAYYRAKQYLKRQQQHIVENIPSRKIHNINSPQQSIETEELAI